MRIECSPARPVANPAPFTDVVYVAERCVRYPAPIAVEAPPEPPRTMVVMGVRMSSSATLKGFTL